MRTSQPDIMSAAPVVGMRNFLMQCMLGVLMRSWSSGGDIRVAARLKSASVPILPLGIEHCIRKLRISTNGLQTLYQAGSGYWQKLKILVPFLESHKKLVSRIGNGDFYICNEPWLCRSKAPQLCAAGV